MITITFLVTLLFINTAFCQVGIGTTNPNDSSMLDVASTTSGILIPRMTEAQRHGITSPAEGLMVCQTNLSNGFWFFDGITWYQLTFGASGEFQSIGGIVQNTTNIFNDLFFLGVQYYQDLVHASFLIRAKLPLELV
ncbi:hypothetical protein [Winogradskyella sp.]|uniref:hypothetical protein n=1 Tax=Winogradskyella sp. TaxID=1883156 RepID=UPI003F6B4992